MNLLNVRNKAFVFEITALKAFLMPSLESTCHTSNDQFFPFGPNCPSSTRGRRDSCEEKGRKNCLPLKVRNVSLHLRNLQCQTSMYLDQCS